MIQRLKQQVQVDVVLPFPIFLHFLGLQNRDDGATTTASSVVAPSSYASLDLHMQNKIFGLIYTRKKGFGCPSASLHSIIPSRSPPSSQPKP
ncbi:hypothetical protein L1987_64450 [Smallanthus sonchifolius]|uniref:Uncharacterized protein n=1 Tax=Smallanthus sonchifolius TaxID=185202 RepID=A0ACB9CG59_9ASTR|nr:hypothetical protein L1987_64450 [Smallanthus sonchifolius]